MTYQPMTNEVRTLIRGLALAYGVDPSSMRCQSATFQDRSYHHWDADSLDLALLETELSLVQDLHPDAGLSCGPRKVHVAGDNFYATNDRYYAGRYNPDRAIHVFHFGAYGCTHVAAFGSLEDALEDAAAVLKEVAPGAFTEPEYPAGLSEDTLDISDEERHRRMEECEADLTYTESGWIPSWEWRVTSFDSISDLLEWAHAGR